MYVKGEHIAAKPAIREFLAMYGRMIAGGGPLQGRGLVPFAAADLTAAQEQSSKLAALNPADLK
jgi:phosphate transport system substrate-binding protein